MNATLMESTFDPNAFSRSMDPTIVSRRQDDNAIQFDQVVLFQWLSRIANESITLEQLLKSTAEVICCQAECLGLWVTQRDQENSFSQIFSVLSEPGTVEWDSFQNLGRRMIKLASSSNQIQSSKLAEHANHQLIVVPVIEGTTTQMMIAGCFCQGKLGENQNEWLMGIFAQCLTNWMSQKKLDKAEVRSRSLNDVVALTSELDRAENLDSAAIILVNQLKKLTQANQVAFATKHRNGLPRLLAVSDLEAIDHSLDQNRAASQACGQSMHLKQIVVYPDRRQDANPSDVLPLEQYCKANNFDACVSVPVITEGEEVVGGILLAIPPKQASEDGYLTYLTQLAQMTSGHLNVVLRANRGLSEHLTNYIYERCTGKMAKVIGVVMAILTLIMLIPFPYRISCDCEIQPVLRRFIAAPHAGILDKNLVENGDVIQAGQIVANLDGRQLRIELAGLEAQLKGTAKKRAASMANSDIAEAQIAMSEIKKLNSEIQLVEDKLQNLEIKSPIDGIVVAGDLEKVEGAPVEMGQTLFEVGPLNEMLAEIAIPETEIPYVRVGMDIRIKLNAFPFKSWDGTIERIHPKTELRNDNSVFIAEVKLQNPEMKLKPGMQGYAKVKSNSYPIGWNLFHQPFEKIRYWTIW